MEFKSIIKAHDLNPWQFIYPNPNFHWQHQSPILIGNIKAQFSLAIFKTQFSLAKSKPNSHWQNQTWFSLVISKLNFHWHYFVKKEPKIINTWQRKNIMVKYHHGKNHGNSLIKKTHWELSWKLCSHIINPWNTWTSFASRHP